MSHERVATTFDEWVEEGRAEGLEHGHGDVVRQVLEHITVRPGFRVLDLGCGTGWATRRIAESAPGVQAIGLDLSPRMIARAEETTSLRIRARFEQGAFEALDFRDAHFDLAFSMEALYYAVDLERALSELRRVLKPGAEAHVVIDCYSERPSTEHWSSEIGLALHHLPEADWRAAFARAGFGTVGTERVRDSRGIGDEADFRPGKHFPDWESYRRYHEAGSLWIRAKN